MLSHFDASLVPSPSLNSSIMSGTAAPARRRQARPRGRRYRPLPVRLAKAVQDKGLAPVSYIALSPLMLVIAALVKLTSPGPVLFRQRRLGHQSRPIYIYKFRTMRTHREPAGRVTPASRDDCRVTAVGKLLRRTSLDELPQFFNVLQGSMSIVGPRPHAVAHEQHFAGQIANYMQRHMVKPGITGWAQVNGLRGKIDSLEKLRQRLDYDLYYIQNRHFWFDLKIVALTILRGFVHPNAY